MKEDWEQDDLWELLGKARPVSVSPFFSRNVLREIRRDSGRSWIPQPVLRWLGAGAFAMLTAGFLGSLVTEAPLSLPPDPAEFTEVFDAATGLDKLVVVEDFSLISYTAGM